MSTSARPPYSTQPTATTLISSTSYNSEFQTNTTTLTSITVPDLPSPGAHKHKLEPILDVYEEPTTMEDRYAEEKPRRTSMDLSRGPSVKDRANQFEQNASSSSSNTPRGRPLPQPQLYDMGRTRSTSPLRVNRRVSSNVSTPTQLRRVPVPATAPVDKLSTQRRTYEFENASPTSDRFPPARLERGSGSAKRMIQQWESLPGTPVNELPRTRYPATSVPLGITGRVMSREYLDQKPLPIPRANPIPPSNHFSSSMGAGPSYSPAKTTYNPSPLQQHLRTPTQQTRKRAATLSPSPSSYSLSPSPSGEKRKRNGGRSPLKEMLNKFGGGIQAIGRKAKGKKQEKHFSRSESFGWDDVSSDERLGTNGLPGGIVFSDRMGEEEMGLSKGPSDPDIIRSSAAMYLIPTPCSSVAQWGSWLSSWAVLTPTTMHITYCPIFQNPSSGHSTPRRVLSGTNPTQASAPAVPFSQIPQPDPSVSPDVEMAMKDCVEVRSLRRDEVRGRGIPPVPEGVGTEVLEMVWSDGSKRYIGVEGVAGRLGWVSAIWDVLLACKSAQPPALPPPSPLVPATTLSRTPTSTIPPVLAAPTSPLPRPEPQQTDFQSRLRALEARSSGSGSSAPPVQKVGDTWVAGSALGIPTSDIVDPLPTVPMRSTSPSPAAQTRGDAIGLRDSVQRMFDLGPDPDLTLERPKSGVYNTGLRQSMEMSERIRAWQPSTASSHLEHSTPSFSRTNSNKSTNTSNDSKSLHLPYTDPEEVTVFPKTETMLSFDPNDLNPSRSASQVRRPASTVVGADAVQQTRRYGMMLSAKNELPLTIVEESSGVESFLAKPPMTHISHITFPKPAVGGVQMTAQPSQAPGLATIPSGRSTTSSEEVGCTSGSGSSRPSTEMHTPLTRPTSSLANTALTSLVDPTVIARLEDHSTDHHKLYEKIDGVDFNLKEIIDSLDGFVRYQKEVNDQPREIVVPKGLDDKLNTLGLDIKNIENTLQLSNLANNVNRDDPMSKDAENEKMLEVNEKLDNIVRLCEQVLSKQPSSHSGERVKSPLGESGSATRNTLTASPSEEEKSAGQEVAQIMADLTGGSSKNSPRLVGLHVLHNDHISAPPSPKIDGISGSTLSPPIDTKSLTPTPTVPETSKAISGGGGGFSEEVTKQIGDVLNLVTELKDARTLQTQQTTDIARYLNELNSWLEKFVLNSSTELSTLSKRLNILVGSSADDTSSSSTLGEGGSSTSPSGGGQPGLPDLVADMHSMMSEQKRRNDSEGLVGQRLDALLGMMGEERERAAGQQNTVEQVVGILERQRQDNELLLRAVATDLTAEIRGERMRFIEAMQQATSVNVSMHVEEFKKLLSTEVNRSMAELGQMREEKKVLEQQISDLFALMAKHGGKGKKNAPSPVAGLRVPPSPGGISQMMGSPVYAGGRGLPLPPH
ncbi:hypothetical protein I302_107447 [Kwoniella bestiolae CBS 10118]|uniref:Uncharacterized protein n=1 Tax=Kwoniella bestiolae CBS 10118 TaxID=1296100 RepID=A0A1B9FYH3_9TREE|nr:hypothetical protein I302_06812 [Kwoniella bestiolae CBS 10118]OCF23828.1 hypothetical protein I302_06812 [Kwoniella bestiolae CBS 10118]